MKYTEKYFEFKTLFNHDKNLVNLDDTMDMVFMPFNSENHWERMFDENSDVCKELPNLGMPDSLFFDNNHFNYPVFIPRSKKKFDKAIILLHGLNERFWDKYLPWAYYLASYTNRPVILFPLSFHMNRSPADWANPRIMAPLVNSRKTKFTTGELTFVNLALSARLTEDPLRFMRSGHQSAEDLVFLANQMEQGLIPFLSKGTRPNFFAYSIGAFVAEILLLANPNQIFSESKFFLFCGGALFKEMYGVSKLIMDQVAYETIYNYYTNEVDKALQGKKTLGSFLSDCKLGKAFYAMLKEDNDQAYREERLLVSSKNIRSIALQKDKVIPASGINAAFQFARPQHEFVETLDFPFDYCHENPFPVSAKTDRHIVDFWFEEVMTKAANFLN